MFDEKFKIAYEKSTEVLEKVKKHPKYRPDSMIETSIVLDCIKEHYCNNIAVTSLSFSNIDIKKPYGAMMLSHFSEAEDGTRVPEKAVIALNADNDAIFQRFSLLHELGHLIINDAAEFNAHDKYVLSTHIDYKITSITKECYDSDKYLLKEQLANIFALRVLMPSEQFYNVTQKFNDISKVSEFFGVTDDAVMSRMMIGA